MEELEGGDEEIEGQNQFGDKQNQFGDNVDFSCLLGCQAILLVLCIIAYV